MDEEKKNIDKVAEDIVDDALGVEGDTESLETSPAETESEAKIPDQSEVSRQEELTGEEDTEEGTVQASAGTEATTVSGETETPIDGLINQLNEAKDRINELSDQLNGKMIDYDKLKSENISMSKALQDQFRQATTAKAYVSVDDLAESIVDANF